MYTPHVIVSTDTTYIIILYFEYIKYINIGV